MAADLDLPLTPDEFAFYFSSKAGVDADRLGIFLQRASTVARRNGGELRVTAIRHGSLAVVLRVGKKVARTVRKEFSETPFAATASAAGLVTTVVTALSAAIAHEGPTPIAKAAVELFDDESIERIDIVTPHRHLVVMDAKIAAQVREQIEDYRKTRRLLKSEDVRLLVSSGRSGNLRGKVILADDRLHFRPDGFRYLIPIAELTHVSPERFTPGKHYQIAADIRLYQGQPDILFVYNILDEYTP